MTVSVTIVTERPALAAAWSAALEALGAGVRVTSPGELSVGLSGEGGVVIDAGCNAYDEDELLSAVGFARARGRVIAVQLASEGPLSSLEDAVVEMCRGLVCKNDIDIARCASALMRRADRGRRERFEFVTLSPRGGEVLAILANGESSLLARPAHASDDGSDVVTITLQDGARVATLELASGARFDLHANVSAPKVNGTHLGADPGADVDLDGAAIGARVRALRLEAGLTQADLAQRTGIYRPNIARVESGRHTPSLDTLSRLASAIGVSPARILFGP